MSGFENKQNAYINNHLKNEEPSQHPTLSSAKQAPFSATKRPIPTITDTNKAGFAQTQMNEVVNDILCFLFAKVNIKVNFTNIVTE